MDGPIDAPSSGQPAVRRIDDRIDLLERHIPLHQFQNPAVDDGLHDVLRRVSQQMNLRRDYTDSPCSW
jgi:hypothetical protein